MLWNWHEDFQHKCIIKTTAHPVQGDTDNCVSSLPLKLIRLFNTKEKYLKQTCIDPKTSSKWPSHLLTTGKMAQADRKPYTRYHPPDAPIAS